jgi:ATP-dependent Lon protease
VPYRFKILSSDLDENVKKIALKKLDYLTNLRPDTGEYAKLLNYID